MKKVLIIEDEFKMVKKAFEYVNDMYFDNELDYTVAVKSQEVPFGGIGEFDYVFVDIKLAKKTDLDGYGILSKIERDCPNVKRIIILTGNNKIKETLIERGIKKDYSVLTKPIDIHDLRNILKGKRL